MKSQSVNEKKLYKKPEVLAVTKQSSNFSAGCQSKTGAPCWICRCS